MAEVDVLIVGSGFGGAVMASRIGQHVRDALPGRTVMVLDKGNDNSGRFDPMSLGGPLNEQGNRFRHTLDPNYLQDIGEVFTDRDGTFRAGRPSMNVVAGKGFGGGSLLYDAVSLRNPASSFELTRDGRRLWPTGYTRASLNPHYDVCDAELKVKQMAWTDAEVPHWQLCTKRDFVFAEGCRRIGATAMPLKLADDKDTNEGWWNQGQRFEGRQDLTKNYLSDAFDAGVLFHSGCEVTDIVPTDRGYGLTVVDRRGGTPKQDFIEARILILGAGCIATTGLLLNALPAFAGERGLDPNLDGPPIVLGRRLSANGDYGAMGMVGPDYELDVEGHKGKPMSSFTPSFWKEHRFILIPFYAAPMYPALGQFTTLLPPEDPHALGRASTGPKRQSDGRPVPSWGRGYKERLSLFSRRMMTMGCLAVDDSEGAVELGPDGRTEVRWRETSAQTEARWSAAVDAMRRIYEALGGELFLDGYRFDGAVNTSHPLGGAPMSDDADHGIVDPNGEAFRNRNLFVVDGSVIPAALGVNPSLTIAAVAEVMAQRLISGDGTEPLTSRLA